MIPYTQPKPDLETELQQVTNHASAAIAEPVGSVLVPLFFVLIGRKVELSGITPLLAVETVVIIVVAILGKSGGAYLGARAAGEPRRSALVFATLMNTRGVTELVFLSIGLDLGVIDSGFYAAMVVMALVMFLRVKI